MAPAVEPLLGSWRTRGEVFGGDGETVVAAVDGHDHYERLGEHFVVHRVDVRMGDEQVEALEVIGPWDAEVGAFPTRAYDNQGGEETSRASVGADGVWSFGSTGAEATMRISDDGRSADIRWRRTDDDGASWRPWMRIRLERAN